MMDYESKFFKMLNAISSCEFVFLKIDKINFTFHIKLPSLIFFDCCSQYCAVRVHLHMVGVAN